MIFVIFVVTFAVGIVLVVVAIVALFKRFTEGGGTLKYGGLQLSGTGAPSVFLLAGVSLMLSGGFGYETVERNRALAADNDTLQTDLRTVVEAAGSRTLRARLPAPDYARIKARVGVATHSDTAPRRPQRVATNPVGEQPMPTPLPTPASIRVIYPNGGEHLLRNTPYIARWVSTSSSGPVRVLLKGGSGGGGLFPLAESTPDDGECAFTIPSDWGWEEWRLIVESSTGSARDESDGMFFSNIGH